LGEKKRKPHSSGWGGRGEFRKKKKFPLGLHLPLEWLLRIREGIQEKKLTFWFLDQEKRKKKKKGNWGGSLPSRGRKPFTEEMINGLRNGCKKGKKKIPRKEKKNISIKI